MIYLKQGATYVRNETWGARPLGQWTAWPRTVGAGPWLRREAWDGRRGFRASRPDAGAGRSATDRAWAHRRAAAPRLRHHQATRRQDRGLVLAEPGNCLSVPRLSGGGRAPHVAS